MAQLPRVGDLFGRYRIDDRIGQGGMGVVFGATDTSFDRRVALKVVSAMLGDSPDFRRRFEREASLLARLSSPHVIDIYDYGVQDGCPYIATQFIAGGDLGHLLQARGAMPPRLGAQVCAQVADALHDAHRTGVVHRDVKPSNVLLRDPDTLDLHAYLCDFGIARTEADGLTVPGSVTGTWSYLSPECGKGASGSPASDIYALGCLFWATLTGAPPFRGSDVEIAIAHQQAPVPQLTGADEFTRQVNLVLTRSLAKDPRHRYTDADQMRTDLLAAAGMRSSGVQPVFQPGATAIRPATPTPSGTPAPPPRSFGSTPPISPPTALSGPRPGPGPRPRRRTSLVVAGACAAVVLVGGGAFVITQLGSDDDDPGPSPEPTTAGPDPGRGPGRGRPRRRRLRRPRRHPRRADLRGPQRQRRADVRHLAVRRRDARRRVVGVRRPSGQVRPSGCGRLRRRPASRRAVGPRSQRRSGSRGDRRALGRGHGRRDAAAAEGAGLRHPLPRRRRRRRRRRPGHGQRGRRGRLPVPGVALRRRGRLLDAEGGARGPRRHDVHERRGGRLRRRRPRRHRPARDRPRRPGPSSRSRRCRSTSAATTGSPRTAPPSSSPPATGPGWRPATSTATARTSC